MTEKLLTVREVREQLGIGHRHMVALIDSGEIPVVRVSPRNVRVRLVDYERFLAKRTSKALPVVVSKRPAKASR